MGIPVEVAALNQQLDFESGEILNILIIKLGADRVISAQVREEDVKTLTKYFVEVKSGVSVPDEEPPAAGMTWEPEEAQAQQEEDPTTTVFGGQPTPPPQAPQRTNVQPVPRARTVAKDEAGYPIVRGGGGVDHSKVVATNPMADEDGVGSI